MNAQETTTSVSANAISKALTILSEDYKQGNQKSSSLDQERCPPTLFNLLETKVQELESIMSSFNLHVRRKIADIRRQQNMVAPIHRLPAELLQYIFLLRVSEHFLSGVEAAAVHQGYITAEYEDHSAQPVLKQDLKEIPEETGYSVIINTVTACSHWYHLALSAPKLWCYLDTSHSLEVAKVLLERSQSTPLYITFSAHVNSGHEFQFMELVIPHIHRWKSFDSHCQNTNLWRGFEVQECVAPLLEKWIIRRAKEQPFFSKIPSFVLERSPNIRDMHIVPLSYPSGSMVLSGITTLSITAVVKGKGFTTQQFELLFSASPRLENVFVNGDIDGRNQVDLFSARLPNLRFMHLHNIDGGTMISLLLSIFPDPSQVQSIRSSAGWDIERFQTMVLDGPSRGSLLDLILRRMTWVSTTCDTEDFYIYLRVGTEAQECNVISLEIVIYGDLLQSTLLSLLHRDEAALITSIHLELLDVLKYEWLGTSLYRCSRLERLTIMASSDLDLPCLCPVITSLTRLSHEKGPRVKHLTFKRINDVQPVLEFVGIQQGASPLIQYRLLEQLERLDVKYSSQPLEDSDREARQQLELLLGGMNIGLQVVPCDIERNEVFMD